MTNKIACELRTKFVSLPLEKVAAWNLSMQIHCDLLRQANELASQALTAAIGVHDERSLHGTGETFSYEKRSTEDQFVSIRVLEGVSYG